MGGGQFCTNPGVVILLESPETGVFTETVKATFERANQAVLLSAGVVDSLKSNISMLRDAGAETLTEPVPTATACHANTLLTVSGDRFLTSPEALQTEAFGPAALLVVVRDLDQATAVIDSLEGSLTGCVYSAKNGDDDAAYAMLARHLRPRVGRLLNDKMPTGVAVSPAMNHGGPYPSTGHPGFTAVGIPASLHRFGALQCYDNVREDRLPPALRNANPNGRAWRLVDGTWTQGGA
jgi:NADP-dependent aldehyde dehydrogenase